MHILKMFKKRVNNKIEKIYEHLKHIISRPFQGENRSSVEPHNPGKRGCPFAQTDLQRANK